MASFRCWALSSKDSVSTIKEAICQLPDTFAAQFPVSVIDKCLLSELLDIQFYIKKTLRLQNRKNSIQV